MNSGPNMESHNSWMHITPQKKHATHLLVLSAARGTGNRFLIWLFQVMHLPFITNCFSQGKRFTVQLPLDCCSCLPSRSRNSWNDQYAIYSMFSTEILPVSRNINSCSSIADRYHGDNMIDPFSKFHAAHKCKSAPLVRHKYLRKDHSMGQTLPWRQYDWPFFPRLCLLHAAHHVTRTPNIRVLLWWRNTVCGVRTCACKHTIVSSRGQDHRVAKPALNAQHWNGCHKWPAIRVEWLHVCG